MSKFKYLSCLHFANINGVISRNKLSDMVSVRRFGHASKPPLTAVILFIEISKCTSMPYGERALLTSTSPSCSFLTSMSREASASVALSSKAYPNGQSEISAEL